MRIVAFDIDGVLTTEQGMEKYNELHSDPNVVLGIITARDKQSAIEFTKENNLQGSFTFLRSTQLKGEEMRNVKRLFSNAQSYTYYGSWFRDRAHAFLAGWEYKQL